MLEHWFDSWRSVLCFIAVIAISSCANNHEGDWVELNPESTSGETLHVTGTVHRLELEGGVFVIRDAGGIQYHPINLPESFRREGMAVEVEARRRDDMASIGMAGPIIEIVRIREGSVP
jgi:hypothetical protein